MSFVSRGTRAAARPLRHIAARQPPRRFAGHAAGHGEAHAGAEHHASGESALNVAGGSGNEGFGRGLYIALGTIPFFMVMYSIASSPGDNALTQLMARYDAGRESLSRRDALHTTMMEKAAADRQLFSSAQVNSRGPPLRMQESFNFGSPYNNSAGNTADLTALAKFYEDQNNAAEQERIARQQAQKGSVYD